MEGETFYHLKAKADIARACEHAGYSATTEMAGEGWRADVLATRGEARIAFEVQWSFLRLEECEYRQQRYEQAGIRACWFFRNPPQVMARSGRTHNAGELKARRDLPLFHLVANGDSTFAVELHRHLYPLAEFVELLLTRRVRFCEHALTRATTRYTARVFDLPCSRCGARSAVYALDARCYADCGAPFLLPLAWQDEWLYAPQTVEALARYRRSDEARGLPFGAVQPRGGATLTQGCARCDRAFSADEILDGYRQLLRGGESEWAGSFEVVMPVSQPIDVALPHWCCPSNGAFCCG